MLRTLILLLFSGLASHFPNQTSTLPRLKVSDNHRFLVTEDGKPFFYLGDTAWELFHRCNREEADMYLRKRAEQGFNVVQAVALAELDGLNTPNPYGATPLTDNDPTKPNEKYFQHVDYIIQRAALHGIYIALLPTWGDKLYKHSWGTGPEIFTPENAQIFGKWIGTRYKNQTNIIWVLGGDRNPRPDTDDIEVWRQMAAGIAEGVGGQDKALMTFHPQPARPGGSSNWFHQDEWLDFNMHQTGHCANQPTYELIKNDYNLLPVKPTLDGEPLYEDHPNCFNAKELGHSLPEDFRRIMYWNVFAGGFGQTYGCHDVWQMYTNDKTPVNQPLRPWPKALDLPGGNQVKHLKNLMLSRPFLSRVPAPSMVLTAQTHDHTYTIATRDQSGAYAMIYFPTGQPAEIDLRTLTGSRLKPWWYDPRTGNAIAGENFSKEDSRTFTPPTSGKGNDWVLVIDDSQKEFGKPGKL
ncbi:MAG: glycoside hydrolase family 140 protein [Bacteroidetes bacterium]|nr:glycoside hydrolase family 140 protein [Bacteroidota bacterium]MCB0846565.1 glycoside hydrolase family 140 protein [Bacteroidota bacterium]